MADPLDAFAGGRKTASINLAAAAATFLQRRGEPFPARSPGRQWTEDLGKLQKGGSGTKGARTVEQRADNGPTTKTIALEEEKDLLAILAFVTELSWLRNIGPPVSSSRSAIF